MPPAIPELLKAERQVLCRGLMPVGVHRHEHDELILVERGEYRARYGAGDIGLEAGQAVWYPAGQAHEPYEPRREREMVFAYLALRCPGDWRPVGDGPLVVADHRARLRSSLAWMIEARLADDTWSRRAAAGLTQAVIAEFQRLHRLATAVDDRLGAVPAFIEAHIADPLTVDEMAAFTGWSRRQFERRFKERYGCSPKAWLRRLRIATAVEHLRTTRASLQGIATLVGFRSVAHLSRAISEQTGRSPGAWRG